MLKRIRTNQNPNNLFDFILIGFITAELQFFGKKKRKWKKNLVKQHLKPAQINEIVISPPLNHPKHITDFKTEVVRISHGKVCIHHTENTKYLC